MLGLSIGLLGCLLCTPVFLPSKLLVSMGRSFTAELHVSNFLGFIMLKAAVIVLETLPS